MTQRINAKPLYTYQYLGRVFSVFKSNKDIFNQHNLHCTDRWADDYGEGEGPTEVEFIDTVRRCASDYVKHPKRYRADYGFCICIDIEYGEEQNEFGVVSP